MLDFQLVGVYPFDPLFVNKLNFLALCDFTPMYALTIKTQISKEHLMVQILYIFGTSPVSLLY